MGRRKVTGKRSAVVSTTMSPDERAALDAYATGMSSTVSVVLRVAVKLVMQEFHPEELKPMVAEIDRRS